MALYETVIIARQDLTADDVDNLSEKLSKVITDFGGKVVSREYWGLRKLSFLIKKNSRGHYVLLNIDANNDAICELNRIASFNEDIIRNLTIKMHPKAKFSESPLMLSKNAKDHKPEKGNTRKHDARLDSIVDQGQFDIVL
jgi:small subunit ribosomal protein S6